MLSVELYNGTKISAYVNKRLNEGIVDLACPAIGYVDGEELHKVRRMFPHMVPPLAKCAVLVNDDVLKVIFNWNLN